MTDEGDDSGDEFTHPTHIRTLRATHKEVRSVLDHQINMLSDIDDMAARTVRITALILAAVLSVPSFGVPEDFINLKTKWGATALTLSIILGMITYSLSSPDLGPNPNDIERLFEEKYREDEWLVILLDSYRDWIDRTSSLNRFNGSFLALTQASLGIGLLLLFLGVLDGLSVEIEFWSLSLISLPIQIIGALAILGLIYAAIGYCLAVLKTIYHCVK